ncbi:MAG: FTR1 family protein [Candidatus Heimdallarchaeota archaeon]
MALSVIVSLLIFSFITSLREVLEAALIIGMIGSYLAVINRRDLFKDVLFGITAAIVLSIGMAWIFLTLFAGLEEYQKLFEAGVMFLAAAVLTWMVAWMSQQAKNLKSEFQEKIDKAITRQEKAGIILLVFFSVGREGAELVLFLYANYLSGIQELDPILSLSVNLGGFVIGVFGAILLAFILFTSTKKLSLQKFFQVTSFLLIVFAAGLVAHGIHEVFEYLEISGSSLTELFMWTEVWNINYTPLGDIFQLLFGWGYDPSYPGRFEKSFIGGILVGLFGWNDNPALIEVIGYLGYYVLLAWILSRIKPKMVSKHTEVATPGAPINP